MNFLIKMKIPGDKISKEILEKIAKLFENEYFINNIIKD